MRDIGVLRLSHLPFLNPVAQLLGRFVEPMINPISFRPGPVTFWTTLIYLALLIPIVIINEKTPAAPKTAEPFKGVNLTEAWLDLTTITRAYHPYNSKFNEEVRRYLLEKVETILEENGASWVFDG